MKTSLMYFYINVYKAHSYEQIIMTYIPKRKTKQRLIQFQIIEKFRKKDILLKLYKANLEFRIHKN